jgi:hypothetical protein
VTWIVLALAMLLVPRPAYSSTDCPPGWVCVPRAVVNQMQPADVAAAKQLAAQWGVRWRITESAGQKRRQLRCASSPQC